MKLSQGYTAQAAFLKKTMAYHDKSSMGDPVKHNVMIERSTMTCPTASLNNQGAEASKSNIMATGRRDKIGVN